jgi:hypothetical protein
MADLRDFTGKNRKFTGTIGEKISPGTTVQRDTSFGGGTLRFNTTTSLLEFYTGTEWKSIDAPPSITSFTINVNGTILNDLPLTDHDGVTLEAINSSVLTDLFSFLKIEDSVPLFNFTNSNAIIQSEQVSSSSDDVVGVKLSYKTYLN